MPYGLRFGNRFYSTTENVVIAVDGNIITISAIGPWNLEFFMQMHLELADIILTRVDISNFAILLILQGDSLAAQDGLEYHLKLVRAGATKAIAS